MLHAPSAIQASPLPGGEGQGEGCERQYIAPTGAVMQNDSPPHRVEPKPVEELTAAEAKAEHEFLIRELERHNQLYYQEDQPEISDADYDRLRQRIEALEQRFPSLVSPESPTQKVGAPPAAKFAKVRHAVRMLSLGNVFTDEEARDFVGRVRRFLKLDATARRSMLPPR